MQPNRSRPVSSHSLELPSWESTGISDHHAEGATMRKTLNGWVCLACLIVGIVCGQRPFTSGMSALADDLPAVTPAAANTPPAKLPAVTPAEHLRLAAEHLDAAGQTALAQHVRQMAEVAAAPKTAQPLPYGPVAPPNAILSPGLPPSEWVPRPVVPSRGRVAIEVPPELDDGSLRFIQPARHKSSNDEIRTTAAPPRGPI